MTVPSYFDVMPFILKALDDGSERSVSEIRKRVAHDIGISEEDISQVLPNGVTKFSHRVGWAITGLTRAGHLDRTGRGIYQLTEAGKKMRSRGLQKFSNEVLEESPSFREWKQSFSSRATDTESAAENQTSETEQDELTPEEMFVRAHREMTTALEADVLAQVRDAKPKFLERVAVELLCAMGFGRGDPKMGTVTGGSGDGGIDGIVLQDGLGLDAIYVQTKLYAEANQVGPGEIQKFSGALDQNRADKGVFVTTSKFTPRAKDAASKSTKRIALIDGGQLAELMVRHGVGVRIEQPRLQFEVKRIDEDYFDQEQV